MSLNKKQCGLVIILVFIILVCVQYLQAAPVGPSVDLIKNETQYGKDGSIINTTGGSITTMALNVTAQNLKWKAYVGNVSGELVLQDASGYSIFDWSLNSVVGEVYATRSPDTVSWGDIKCSNETHITNEEIALNHTNNPSDNISATFSTKQHETLYVGTEEITQNSCFSIHTNVNNETQESSFEEIILYDGAGSDDGDIVYGTKIEQNVLGYDNEPYDFQMIVPERGLSSWESSTAYYFYVEIT